MVYTYRVKNPQGNIIEGTMEANEQQAVVNRLREQKFIILDIAEDKKNFLAEIAGRLNILKPKVKSKDVALFSRQLSTMVSSGVPIVQGLNILVDQIEKPVFKEVVARIKTDIESGITIADAMERHPKVFNTLYVSMIRAGELGGILDIILDRLSGYLESSEELAGKVKAAMAYPVVISLVLVGVVGFVLLVIVPQFTGIFAEFGAELPLPTRILVKLSELVKQYIIFLVLGMGGIVFALRKYHTTEKGGLKLDAILLKMPVFGILFRKIAIAKFTRTFGTLIKSGVPILQAMDTVGKTSGNRVIEEAIKDARESIREGERIAEPLKRSNVFPPMVIQMIAVGEETGNLDTMLSKIADFYDAEVDSAVEGLTAMIEPLIIVILGVVAGGMVITMYLPMFEMGQLAGGAG